MPVGPASRSVSLTRVERWGVLALLVRPVYVAVELAVAAATTGHYSLTGDSVSRLGESACAADFCSPRHGVMNVTFVVVGVLLAAGAALLARRLGPVATCLLVVAGLSSVATGLAPLDAGATRHAVAATPLFVAHPAALLVLARRFRPDRPRTAAILAATGVVAAVSAVAFVVLGEGGGSGLAERLALWPVLPAVAAAGVVVSRQAGR